MQAVKSLLILVLAALCAVGTARADTADATAAAYQDCVVNFRNISRDQVIATARASTDLQSGIKNLTTMSIAACGDTRNAVKDAAEQEGQSEDMADQKLAALDRHCEQLIAVKVGGNIVKYQP